MEEQTIYKMRNDKINSEIECTEKFIQDWKDRGFKIISTRQGKLID